MKKISIYGFLLTTVLALAGCSSPSDSSTSAATKSTISPTPLSSASSSASPSTSVSKTAPTAEAISTPSDSPKPSASKSTVAAAPSTPSAPSPASTETQAAAPAPATVSTALAVAQSLQTRGRAPDTNYSRDAFGSAWRDVDRNGCDTRNDILKRDFTTKIFQSGTRDCKVIGGTWTDPYSNESYTFDSAPSRAQIDHVVSLKNAWVMGADLWNDQQRLEFANDPMNLKATISSLNQQKGDSNAASWLPPYRPGRCAFIATQVAVKAKWSLYVTDAEKEVFVSILSKPECSQTQLPN